MLKVSSLRDLTIEELRNKLADLEEERFNLFMRRSLKQLDNPLRLRELRREFAKITTIINEDEKGIRKLSDQKTTVLSSADSKKEDKKK